MGNRPGPTRPTVLVDCGSPRDRYRCPACRGRVDWQIHRANWRPKRALRNGDQPGAGRTWVAHMPAGTDGAIGQSTSCLGLTRRAQHASRRRHRSPRVSLFVQSLYEGSMMSTFTRACRPLLLSRPSPSRARRCRRHSASRTSGRRSVCRSAGRSVHRPTTSRTSSARGRFRGPAMSAPTAPARAPSPSTQRATTNSAVAGRPDPAPTCCAANSGYDQNTWTGRFLRETQRSDRLPHQRAVSADDARQRKDHRVIPADGNGNRVPP